jgi:Immunity protein 12
MGGPEHMEVIQPVLISLRKALKLEFVKLQVPELMSLDLTAYFNGSVMSYFPEGGVLAAKYKKAKKEFAIDLSFLTSDVADLSRHKVLIVIKKRFLECADAVPIALEKRAIQLDANVLSGAMEAAFRRLDLE